ncbi:hypothetical protein H0H87_003463, partial [Tephrocybe sp. NHM501043]
LAVNGIPDDAISNPTGSEYAREAAKEFLAVLEDVAQAVPVPRFGAAVKIAANLIKACEDSHATLQHAEELKTRIKNLVVVLVDEVKGKKADEIQATIRQDIEALERSLNEEKLAHNIKEREMLFRLEQRISAFHAQQQRDLQKIQAGVDDVQITINYVKAKLDKRSPSSTHARAIIPSNTAFFYGRDNTVSDLVSVLVQSTRQHVCLLGPGGMGKSSTSLAVMTHVDVQARFPGKCRVWVPCVKATSISLFLDTL